MVGGSARARVMLAGVVSLCVAASQPVLATGVPAAAPPSVSSSPPDRTAYVGRTTGHAGVATSASGVYVTDPSLSSSSLGGSEPSIAVNPANPNQIAITRFAIPWNTNVNADLLFSPDGGSTWTDQSTIPPPPGVAGTAGCPCDQTIDYGRDGRLYGTFLTFNPATGATTVVTGSTTDPTNSASWGWNGNQLTSGNRTAADQPWLLVNRDPAIAGQDNVYVAYDDFAAGPDARVAVSFGANPVNITVDNKAGTESPLATNPGLRLANDPRNGTMYALYEQSTGLTQPKNVTYKLNRSTDRGSTWTLNGSVDGLTVDTVLSDQAPGFKFGTVNALLGGVDHAAVDPSNGDVYVVYGQHVSVGNQIKIRRLQANATGGLDVGPANNVSLSTNAALPSVAVLTDGTVGVLYDSFEGIVAGLPKFSAHLARSTDHGASFSDVVLESFQSPVADNGNARQRVFGDYQQIKAVGTTFYGVFSGNRNAFGSMISTIDPIFFKAKTPNEVGVAGAGDSGLWRLQDTPPPTPFTGLGGAILAAPAVVSVPTLSGGSGVPIYIATGGDHALWVRSQTQDWRPLASSGTFCIDNPAGVVVQSKPAGSLIFVAACHGGDNALWFAQEPISPGTLPDPSLVFHSLGGQMVAGPAVAAIDPLGAMRVDDELTFFVNGTNGHVWTRTLSVDWSQQPWSCIGHPAASTVVIPAPPPPAFEASLFACQGTNTHLWIAINFGGGWGPAFDVGGLLVDGPGAAADPEGPVVYVEGRDGAVWRWDGAFTPLGGSVLHGVGAAAVQFLNNTGSLLGRSWGFRSP